MLCVKTTAFQSRLCYSFLEAFLLPLPLPKFCFPSICSLRLMLPMYSLSLSYLSCSSFFPLLPFLIFPFLFLSFLPFLSSLPFFLSLSSLPFFLPSLPFFPPFLPSLSSLPFFPPFLPSLSSLPFFLSLSSLPFFPPFLPFLSSLPFFLSLSFSFLSFDFLPFLICCNDYRVGFCINCVLLLCVYYGKSRSCYKEKDCISSSCLGCKQIYPQLGKMPALGDRRYRTKDCGRPLGLVWPLCQPQQTLSMIR